MKKRKMFVVQVGETGYPVGESHHRAKLSDSDVNLIRDLHEEYEFGYKKLAFVFEVSRDTIRQICTYRRRNASVMGHRKIWVEVPDDDDGGA